jgi:hypothetical protein
MWGSVRDFPGAVVNALAWIAGVAAAALPKRWWPALDPYIPATDSAPVAAILTILAAGAIGVPGFVSYASDQVSHNNRAILAAATDQASRPASQETVSERDWGRMFVGASGLSLFTFIFLTPAGWASTYLGISGTWRGIAAAVDDPFGDPILTGLDAILFRVARRTGAHATRRRRESLEGPEVPDRVVRGLQIGMDNAELVIIASRRKPHWDAGTVVDTGERWFRVSSIEERTIGGWLRTLYGLAEHRDLEAFRRRVTYEMPTHVNSRTAGDHQDSAS